MGKINGNHVQNKTKPELIYVYDALCGWCYGFSPVMTRLKDEIGDKIDFLVLSGGMIRGESTAPISSMYNYLKKAYKEVENLTGVKFGENFLNDVLEDGSAILNSEPPALALAAFRLEKKEMSVDFAAALQKAIYYDGMHADDMDGYSKIAETFGVDPGWFNEKINDPEVIKVVENEFKMVSGMGVEGFPTVLLRNGEDVEVVARGYKSFDTIFPLVKDMAGL